MGPPALTWVPHPRMAVLIYMHRHPTHMDIHHPNTQSWTAWLPEGRVQAGAQPKQPFGKSQMKWFCSVLASKPDVAAAPASHAHELRVLSISLQNDSVLQQLATIFMHCYGTSPIPSIPEIRKTLPARLGVYPRPLGLVPTTLLSPHHSCLLFCSQVP